jgi:hypothetical protein
MLNTIGRYLEVHEGHVEKVSVLVNIIDDETRDEGLRIQVYDGGGNHISDLGFISCPIVNHKGSMMMGHKMFPITKGQERYIKRIEELINSQENE